MGLPETSEKPTPCILETRKKLLLISMVVVSASLSADPIFNPKDDASFDLRSLKKTDGVSERVMI